MGLHIASSAPVVPPVDFTLRGPWSGAGCSVGAQATGGIMIRDPWNPPNIASDHISTGLHRGRAQGTQRLLCRYLRNHL